MGFISILLIDALFFIPFLLLLLALLRFFGISDTFSETVKKIEQSELFIKLKKFFSILGQILSRIILISAILVVLYISLSFIRTLLFAS